MHQVLIEDPKELEKIRDRESDITKERIQKVLAAGANVVLTTKGIDDMSLKYFVEAGVIACRRVPKEDLRRVPASPLLAWPSRILQRYSPNFHYKKEYMNPCLLCLTGRRVAKATGAQMVLTLADMDGNETFDASALGTAEEVRLSCEHSLPPGLIAFLKSLQLK